LQIGAGTVPIVKVIVFILYPVAKPVALLLDLMLGEELGTIHSKEELAKLLEIHVRHGSVDEEVSYSWTDGHYGGLPSNTVCLLMEAGGKDASWGSQVWGN